MEILMDRQTKKTDKRTRQNYTTIESNLVIMVIYLPVKFEFDWKKCFRVRVKETEMLTDKRKKTDKITPILKAT